MPSSKGKWSEEEERMISEGSHDVSWTTQVLFYGNALTVSALPLWLYWRVQMMDMLVFSLLFLVMTGVSTWLVAFAYKKVKFNLRHKIAIKREAAVSKEVLKELNDSASGKKLSKLEKDEKVAHRKNEVSNNEATAFSIFYNNALFFFLFMLIAYFFRLLHPGINYVLSVGGTAFLLALLSTGA